MVQENNGKRYWNEVGLVVLGAFMASIPTLTATYMHDKSEVQRLVIDRQISAIKDFLTCTNKAAIQVLPEIEKDDEEISSLYERYKQKRITEKEIISVLNKRIASQRVSMRTWQAEYNTQRIVINALFHVNLNAMDFSDPKDIEYTDGNGNVKSLEASLKVLKESKGRYRKAVLDVLDNSNKLMNSLASMININNM